MAWALLIGGVIMWVVDAVFTRPRVMHMEEMSLPQAIWIGAAQILSAVFPGTSRSMSTIAAGQVAGMSRPAALEFSFFLSMPTMAVATGYDFLKTVMPHHHEVECRAPANGESSVDGTRNRIYSFIFSWRWEWSPGLSTGCEPADLYPLLSTGLCLGSDY
jgi:Uncharacterized bacitracin resistance protein